MAISGIEGGANPAALMSRMVDVAAESLQQFPVQDTAVKSSVQQPPPPPPPPQQATPAPEVGKPSSSVGNNISITA